jgi:hypothetical protein
VADPAGIVLARDDGVIVVLDAVPISAELQQQIDAVCDALGAPKRGERTEDER